MSHDDTVRRWVAEAHKDNPKFIRGTGSNVFVGNTGVLYSYGLHFPMAYAMTSKRVGNWFLLNGDTYSVTTTRHQSYVQNATRGKLALIVPFEVLRSAHIDRESIEPIEVLSDRNLQTPRESTNPAVVPWRGMTAPEPDADGVYRWVEHSHFLGAAVFRAKYRHNYKRGGSTMRQAYFLSAFDENEPLSRRPYFLAQLPHAVESVREALESLRPDVVKDADRLGLAVVRQGDIFAVPTELTTRELKTMGATGARRDAKVDAVHVSAVVGPYGRMLDATARGDRATDATIAANLAIALMPQTSAITVESVRVLDVDQRERAKLIGTRHAATEVMVLPDGTTYARGTIRHLAEGGRPVEHVQQKLGKAWHLIVQNTVPRDGYSNTSRAWQSFGRVD